MLKKIVRYLKLRNKLSRDVIFDSSVYISNSTQFEGPCKLYKNSYLDGFLGIGSYIGNNSVIIGHVGRYTSIGQDVKVLIGTHPYTSPYASTSPVFYSTRKQAGITFTSENTFDEIGNGRKSSEINGVFIGNDVWVGERVMFVNGVKIGDGAVVLAGSVVTKDVEPFSVVGGTPAKHIKFRYCSETIVFLMELKWWEKPIEWLKTNSHLFIDLRSLKNEYSKK